MSRPGHHDRSPCTGCWNSPWSNANEEIRGDFSYEVADRVDPKIKARLARMNPELAAAYVAQLEQHPKPAYAIDEDPDGRVVLWEYSESLARTAFTAPEPTSPEGFCVFVNQLINEFKHSVEESNLWSLLWHGGRGLAEKGVQVLLRWGWLHYCKAHDVDISPESNAGRGPVDFKFSKGWEGRALAEVKLMRNRKFWDGLQVQTVQYMRSEQITCGFFVAIAYTDRDMETDRVQRVAEAAADVSADTGLRVKGVVIDARPKQSASKLKRR